MSGGSILERAEAHGQSLRRELKCIKVPEWESEIYFYEHMTMGERVEVLKNFKQDCTMGEMLEGAIYALIVRSRNKDGQRLWNKTDRLRFRHVDGEVVMRVFNEMGGNELSIEESEKN